MGIDNRNDATGNGPPPQTSVRSHMWMDTFERSTGDRAIAGMVRFARKRLRGVARLGGVVDSLTPREMILDILSDIFEGTLTWDPERDTLRAFVERVVQSRTYHLRKHAINFGRESLDDREQPFVETTTDITPALQDRDLGIRVLAEMRVLSVGDADVLRLVEAYARGAEDKTDVIEITNMSARVYDRTRKRFNRFVEQLSPELRECSSRRA
jgi:hypothetical protein